MSRWTGCQRVVYEGQQHNVVGDGSSRFDPLQTRRMQGWITRFDGWCWRYAQRDTRLVKLSQMLKHRKWVGPKGQPVAA